MTNIRNMKRDDLDQYALDQGIDPAMFSRKDDLIAYILEDDTVMPPESAESPVDEPEDEDVTPDTFERSIGARGTVKAGEYQGQSGELFGTYTKDGVEGFRVVLDQGQLAVFIANDEL